MNLLLLEPGELAPDGTARLSGRRARHVHEVLRAAPGDTLQVGELGGRMGTARLLAVEAGEVVLAATLDHDPPPPSPVALVLALPRPKILKRVLAGVASMGVKRVALVGSYRVEKAYWGSPWLAPDAVRAQLALGLEQGRDTALPVVSQHRLFKPFVEDALDAIFPGPARLLAHPADAGGLPPPPAPGAGVTLAVGPEGGWTAYEAGRLREAGFLPFTLGPRVLRVDTAVPFALGLLERWLRARAG